MVTLEHYLQIYLFRRDREGTNTKRVASAPLKSLKCMVGKKPIHTSHSAYNSCRRYGSVRATSKWVQNISAHCNRYQSLNHCVARVCCKSARHWLTAAPSNSTQTTHACGVDQLLCFRCMQAITADTVIVYITHDDRPNISPASCRHGAKRRGGLFSVFSRTSLHADKRLPPRPPSLLTAQQSRSFCSD